VSLCYFDTSALAKWYLPERGSAEFERFVNRSRQRRISRLVTVELRCLLARRRRAGEIDAGYEADAWSAFTSHTADGVFAVEPMPDACFREARVLIEHLPDIPLRTLDALHLAMAQAAGATVLATGDGVQGRAAAALGLEVAFFGAGAT
jgi:predicted nucleic acid-binding protein